MSVGSTSNSGGEAGFPAAFGRLQGFRDQSPGLISLPQPGRSRNTGHALREGHDRSSAQSPSSASGPSSAPPQLSCLTRTPGQAPRPARSPHTTLPGRLVLGFHFIQRRPDLERLRACGHPSWRAQELRAEELWAMG